MLRPALAIHGGAGLIRRASLSSERHGACVAALHVALDAGAQVLTRGGSALDAAQSAVVVLEDSPLFNAGRGSVLNAAGTIEMEAAVMCGARRRAGAVSGLTCIRHPVLAARRILEDTPHAFLSGPAADAFAIDAGLEAADRSWFVIPERQAQLDAALAAGSYGLDHGGDADDVYGTVGAVACDTEGHVAAATSTGGMVAKAPGRVGDTPVIGAGTWACDATAAISGTGHGEHFIQHAVAARISSWMEIGGLSVTEAADRVVRDELPSAAGGVIAIDRQGHIAMPFTTGGMFRGSWRPSGPDVRVW